MTLLEMVKAELDTLPEECLPKVQEFVSFQKYQQAHKSPPDTMSDEEYLKSIPGMWESIIEGINTPLSECIPEEDVIW